MGGIAFVALARPSLVVPAKEIAEAFGRAPRGVDHVRVPAWDEDASTLALDAAAEALRLARLPGSALRSIVVVGADGALLATALDAPRARVHAADPIDAFDLAFSLPAPCLVAAATEPAAPAGTEARIEQGAAGVAFLLTDDGGLKLASSTSFAAHAPGADDELASSPLDQALARLAAPKGTQARRAIDARKEWGDLGALAPLVQLAESLREPLPKGQWLQHAAASPQRAVVLALESEGPVQVAPPPERARSVGPVRAMQESRAFAANEAIPDSPMGAFVPVGTWVEDLPARLRLVAQRCDACGHTAYPPRGACPKCRGRAFSDVQLPPTALVHAATRIGRGGAPSEFALEQAQTGAYWVGVVEWPEQGVRVTARLAGYDEHGPAIGDTVRAVVRRLFEQQGAVRYGVKFTANGP